MKANELRKLFLQYFESRGHKVIPSASLVPENDPTVLFTTAGMHPLVPYLVGEKHPAGKRLASAQKCIRTDDIDEVGNKVHHTFFEMLGNWSLGDYFKKEAIEMSFEFLTDKKWLGLDKNTLAISVFEGDKDAPFDEESFGIWQSLGIPTERIAKLPKKNNWWGPAGEVGPCGPDTEMFYWTGKSETPKVFDPDDANWVEIWNDVFMQYNKVPSTILVDGMHCLYDKDFNINQELLQFLNNIGNKKMLVVNGYREKAKELFKDYDFEIFSLEEEKTNKDDPLFFKRLIDKYNLDPKELIYFDHAEENVSSAKQSGILSELYKDKEQVKKFVETNLYYFASLVQKNVDTGMGLERMLAVMNGFDDNYKTDLFWPIIEKIEEISGKKYEGNEKEFRIIADHIKAAVFAISDGVLPSNKGAGYIVRRLLRRAIVKGQQLGIKNNFTDKLADIVFGIYDGIYYSSNECEKSDSSLPPSAGSNNKMDDIKKELLKEEEKFRKTLKEGLKIISEQKEITSKFLFDLYQSFGIPLEIAVEEGQKGSKGVTEEVKREYEKLLRQHQELSRTASAGMFKGGLADAGDVAVKYHTTTHLLHQALRQVLGDHVQQKGSNINSERLRFDFVHPDKMTPEQVKEVEDLVNEKIKEDLPVTMEEMSPEEAKNSGALGFFEHKYGDIVKVYTVGPDSSTSSGRSEPPFSREICGGPHVSRTGELRKFKITKEESSSAGVRRIKAVLI